LKGERNRLLRAKAGRRPVGFGAVHFSGLETANFG
jgi:hypothetical protein